MFYEKECFLIVPNGYDLNHIYKKIGYQLDRLYPGFKKLKIEFYREMADGSGRILNITFKTKYEENRDLDIEEILCDK